MADLSDGAQEFRDLAVRLRQVGSDLAPELLKGVKHAASPIPGEIRAGLKPKLPDRYAEVLSGDTSITVQVRSGTVEPGVRVTAKGRGAVERRRLRRLDQGILAHPLWGDRQHWKYQDVTPGWFTTPCLDAEPRVRDDILSVMHDIADRATRRI